MSSNASNSQSSASPVLGWLARVNSQVSQWAASMSWWRLIMLFLLVLVASSIIGQLLHLKHDRERVAGPHKDVNVTIGGRNGIRITTAPTAPPLAGASGPSTTPDERNTSDAEKNLERAIEKAVEDGLKVTSRGR